MAANPAATTPKVATELVASDRIEKNGKWRKISYVAKSTARVTAYFANGELEVIPAVFTVGVR